MTTPIVFNDTVFQDGYADAYAGAPQNQATVENTNPYPITIDGTINKVGDTVSATANNGDDSATLTAENFDNSTAIALYDQTTNETIILSNDPLTDGQTINFNQDNLQSYDPPCFAAGTLIRTTRGDVAVEALQVGDRAITTSGAARPVRWLGHRTVDCRRHLRPQEVLPVRIAAHAFGANRPARDLAVSPGHALCIDVDCEVLIPASALVNGTTIAQLEVEEVTYWHVELDAHDIILAENMPAESYLEMGNRSFFTEAEVVALHARPDAPVVTHADFCRSYVDGGPRLEAVRTVLRDRLARAAGTARGVRRGVGAG